PQKIEAARTRHAALAAEVAALGVPLAAGQCGELCPLLAPWLATVTAPLSAGVALFLDYGTARAELYAPARAAGTLACFHRQRRHDDPFVRTGLQDVTAWVDFTRVAEAALACGLEVAGYTTQAHFLLATGFEAHLAALRAELPPSREPLAARAAARLVLPSDMGERFKCLALARGYDAPLAGFALRDFTATL
ncbi:MAG: SAM-dependent methyltransferase, partial [Proteobacteria bacterium]|nr:SAM-dependent methyltransferase [Pseudomonadota bacterium]